MMTSTDPCRALGRLAAVLLAAFSVAACDGGEPEPEPEPQPETRQPLGKEDADAGSCEAACGGKSAASCWCDAECVAIGDCCSDYEAACVEVTPSAEEVLCETTGGTWGEQACACPGDQTFDTEAGCEDDTTAPQPSAAEVLCESTGGTWAEEACACPEDATFDATDGCPAPTVEPDLEALKTLCEETGGAWETDDTCECQQDGHTMNLNYTFDPEEGCVPGEPTPVDLPTLCDETGGVWEDGQCECAQDGASFYYVFDPEVGCGFPDVSPLRESILAGGAAAFFTDFAPAAGDSIFIIDRPGAIDAIYRFDDFGDALDFLAPFDWPAFVGGFGACPGELQDDGIPTVSCEDDAGMEPPGCHFIGVAGFTRAGDLMQALVDFEIADYSAAEIQAALDAGHLIQRLFIDSRHGVTFGFVFRDGAWRLGLIDLSRYSCSA